MKAIIKSLKNNKLYQVDTEKSVLIHNTHINNEKIYFSKNGKIFYLSNDVKVIRVLSTESVKQILLRDEAGIEIFKKAGIKVKVK